MRSSLARSAYSTEAPLRPTWVTVSLGAFAHNVRILKAIAAPARLMAILKADAYGHGASRLAPVALENGADIIGVSSIEEGVALREAGIESPILLLGSVYPLENFTSVVANRLLPSLSSLEAATELARIAVARGVVAECHLKVDTGMGRLGVSPTGAKPVLQWLRNQPSLRLKGIYTHFASADTDSDFTARQLSDLLSIRNLATSMGFGPLLFHSAGSSGLLAHPETRLDMVRPGIALYGAAPLPLPAGMALRPVLSWRSAIVFQKRVPAGTTISYGRTWTARVDSDVATIPVGYADGVPRSVAGKAVVLVRGRRCPVIGTITMDHVMIDVTGVGTSVGDEVILIGEQNGDRISVENWAQWANTISYEIFTGLSKRVPRMVIA